MTECTNCKYLIGYADGTITCLMKQELAIIDGKTSYPKNCGYFKEGKK